MTAPPKRHWLRFGLRTMFVVVTVACLFLGIVLSLVMQMHIVRERKAIVVELQHGDVPVPCNHVKETLEAMEGDTGRIARLDYHRVSPIRRWLGDESVVRLSIPPYTGNALIERAEYAFPEAMLFSGDEAFRDALTAPAGERQPNAGTIFTTGLIEK